MKKTRLTAATFAITTALLFSSCNKSEENTMDFSTLTQNYFDDKNHLNPIDATLNGQEKYAAELQFEMTDGYRAEQQQFFDKYRDELKKIDTAKLSPEEKISYDIIKWEIEVGGELLKHPTNLLPVQQFYGTYLTMAQFAGGESAQPFKTEGDYRNFLERMDKYGAWLDSAMVYMRKGMAQKIVLPKSLTVKMIPQFESMVTENYEDNIFYTTVKNMPASFPEKAKSELAAKYAETINSRLVPKFTQMVAFLKNDYLPACKAESGYGSYAFGNELYKVLVKQWTTTNMTPVQIHELGLREVARIRSEMEKIKNQVGFKGDLKDFFNYVREKKELKPFKTPQEVIANFERIHAIIKPNVNKFFSLQPKTPFEIRRTEAFREKSASAEYIQGAADGTRPGIFYVPIPDVTNYNYYADEDLFLHEAIPGHHFQISLQQENQQLPDFRKFAWFGAEGEGWALYTESLGKELGLYNDPYQYFGMLGSEMLRATRLVVDTGLHSKGWTREQAIQYKMENEAEPAEGIVMEVERYMAMPGQALSYKIGQLKIIELRKRAEAKLGSKFDIREFHAKVLESGVMPLALLEEKIDKWIGSKK